MEANVPKNIVERIEQALDGKAWANQTFRGKTKLTSFHFPRPSRNYAGNSDTKLVDYINRQDQTGNQHSRAYAELNWAKTIAVGLHIISGFETPDKKYISKVFAARKQVDTIRKQSSSYWNDPKYKAALENYEKVWKGKFSTDVQQKEILEKTYSIQDALIQEFADTAVSSQLIDHKSLFRLEPVVRQYVAALNSGVSEDKLIQKNDTSLQQDSLYNLMLNEEYGADTSAQAMLASRMLEKHLSEIQAFADTQSHHSKSGKKEIPFNIDIGQYASGGYINFDDEKAAPLHSDMKDTFGKKTGWSVVVKFKCFDNGRVSLNTGLRIVGRQESNSFITSKPDFDSWLERLPHSPQGTEASLSTEQAREAYIKEQSALEAARLKGEEENKARREEALRQQAEKDAARAEEVKILIEENYSLPLVTKETAKGTQIETKQIMEILDYEELHGLLRHAKLYEVPTVSIQMGLDIENTRGIQHLANPPYLFGSEENDNIGNKRFETMNNDMKNCFVQLGNIGPNTTIIQGEGFSTMASLYIAAKRKELDVACVAAMFVDNIKYSVEHYKKQYPNNPMLNGADNDSWNKGDERSLRSIKDNAGLRMGLILHDSYGIQSFSLDWENLGVHDKALETGACDFNDAFDVFGYEEALAKMGTQLEHMINTYNIPAKDMVGKRIFADAEYGKYESIFEVYGIDPELKSSNFITHTGEPIDFNSINQPSEQNDNAKQKTDATKVLQTEPTSAYELQKFESDSWVKVDIADTAKDILIKQDLEKRFAIDTAYASLIEDGTEPTIAFNKALEYVESTFRCYGAETDKVFNSIDTYNDSIDQKLTEDVVLFIENENGYVRPIRLDENNDLVIGGGKDNVQPRFNSRLQAAKAIDAVLTEIEYSDIKAFELATEESFKLRTLNAESKPLRDTDRTFSDEFGLDTRSVINASINEDAIGVKFIDQTDYIDVTCNTTSPDTPIITQKLDKNELGYALDSLKKNSSIIEVDSGTHKPEDLDFNIESFSDTQSLFVLKSYAPNGAQNGEYYLQSNQELQNKVEDLKYGQFLIPTTTFQSSNGGLTPLHTSQEELNTELMPAQALSKDQEYNSEQEVNKYLASINKHSIENNTPNSLPTRETGDRKLVEGIWYDNNKSASVGGITLEDQSPNIEITEQEMADNVNAALADPESMHLMGGFSSEEEDLLAEIDSFREEERMMESNFTDSSFQDLVAQATEYQEQDSKVESAIDNEDLHHSENDSNNISELATSISNGIKGNVTSIDDDLDVTNEDLESIDEYQFTDEEMEYEYEDITMSDMPVDDFAGGEFGIDDFEVEFSDINENELEESLPSDSELFTGSNQPDASQQSDAEVSVVTENVPVNASETSHQAKVSTQIETNQQVEPAPEVATAPEIGPENVSEAYPQETTTSQIQETQQTAVALEVTAAPEDAPHNASEPSPQDADQSQTIETQQTVAAPEVTAAPGNASHNASEPSPQETAPSQTQQTAAAPEMIAAPENASHNASEPSPQETAPSQTQETAAPPEVTAAPENAPHNASEPSPQETAPSQTQETASIQPDSTQQTKANAELSTVSNNTPDTQSELSNQAAAHKQHDSSEHAPTSANGIGHSSASYGQFTTTGSWNQMNTTLNHGRTYDFVISKMTVGNALPPAQNIKKTEVQAPSEQKLSQLLKESKLRAWNSSKAQSSVLDKVSAIDKHNETVSERAASTPIRSIESDEDKAAKRNVESDFNQETSKSSINNVENENNGLDGNVIKALETLGQMLSSGELENDDVANILQKFSKVNDSVNTISDRDMESLGKNSGLDKLDTPKQRNVPKAVPTENTKAQGTETSGLQYNEKGLPVPLTFADNEPIDNFSEFEFPLNVDVSHFVERAQEEVGDKGDSAVFKKASFLMSAALSPNAPVNTLAQNAIDVLCHINPPVDALMQQEYATRAGEVANWLNSVAKVGMVIESQRSDEGKLPAYSKLDKRIQIKVQEALIRPVNEIKRDCNNDYIDFVCIKEAIEKRQIPYDTLKQVLYGAYKNRISKATGLHGERYKSGNTKLNDKLDVVLAKLVKNGDFTKCVSQKGTYLYKDPVDGTEASITQPEIMAASAEMMAIRDLEAAIEIPKDVRKMSSVGREKAEVVIGRCIQEATGIQSPIYERREPKTAYTPVGRLAKKEASANVPEGMAH
ncbi:hypothetical protein OCT63_19450 [Vibrio sp. RW]|uniref:hypothetical protein n=1 Tax=Vibrio sp. RW TaxID=2998833 RepID=UPI0022CDAAC4|nr:hypothetical protein [Vibrio sp. RW]MDA0146405.1 hypothetical protein [Vibrio sp. RW]